MAGINPEIIVIKLNNSVDDVDFICAYPNDELILPSNGKYLCALKTVFNDAVKMYNKNKCVKYMAELLSPIGKTGIEIFNKAQQISDAFLNMSTEVNNIRCTIGDITYSKTQHSYTVNIECEITTDDSCKKISMIIDNHTINAVLLSESESKTSCNIMSYGSSKPVDTLLENSVYKLKIRVNGEFLGDLTEYKGLLVTYEFGDMTVVYSDCVVNKCVIVTGGSEYLREYDITSYKRELKML
ncbi:MAG: hypothetical protein UIM53_04085 [Acutalibacteraceae bacterium]|nr:hypothetical protein [Acutalibacteraceae bacterium]